MRLPPSKYIGFVENLILKGDKKQKKVLSRIDSGAVISSIDTKLAAELGLGPIIRTKKVKNANGMTQRPVMNCKFVIKGKEYETEVTIADRKHLTYRVLIGQNLLKKTDLYINPRKSIPKK